jgi:hypothetical protein
MAVLQLLNEILDVREPSSLSELLRWQYSQGYDQTNLDKARSGT